jgi:hypothetical protein
MCDRENPTDLAPGTKFQIKFQVPALSHSKFPWYRDNVRGAKGGWVGKNYRNIYILTLLVLLHNLALQSNNRKTLEGYRLCASYCHSLHHLQHHTGFQVSPLRRLPNVCCGAPAIYSVTFIRLDTPIAIHPSSHFLGPLESFDFRPQIDFVPISPLHHGKRHSLRRANFRS